MGITDWSISTDAIIGAVIALIILIFLIFNAIYWYQITYEFNNKELVKSALAVSKSTAQALMILSIIGAIIVALYMLYNGARWFYSSNFEEAKRVVATKYQQTKKGIVANFPPKKEEPVAKASPPPLPPRTTVVQTSVATSQSTAKVDDAPPKSAMKKTCVKDQTPKYDPKQVKFICSEKGDKEEDQKIGQIYPKKIDNKDGYEIIGTVPNLNGGRSQFTLDTLNPPPKEVLIPPVYNPSGRNYAGQIDLEPVTGPSWFQRFKTAVGLNKTTASSSSVDTEDLSKIGDTTRAAITNAPMPNLNITSPAVSTTASPVTSPPASPPLSRSNSPAGTATSTVRTGLPTAVNRPFVQGNPNINLIANQPPLALVPPPPLSSGSATSTQINPNVSLTATQPPSLPLSSGSILSATTSQTGTAPAKV